MPTHLNGLDISPYATVPHNAAQWEALANTMPIDEPEFDAPAGYKKAAGVIICEPDGRMWVVALVDVNYLDRRVASRRNVTR